MLPCWAVLAIGSSAGVYAGWMAMSIREDTANTLMLAMLGLARPTACSACYPAGMLTGGLLSA